MRFLLLLVLVVACGEKQTATLSRDYVSGESPADAGVVAEAETTYKKILRTQEQALNALTEKSSSGYQMREMITDISFARTGVLGLSALKANSGVEIRWAKRTLTEEAAPVKSDFVIESETSLRDATEGVLELVKASGKVKVTDRLRTQVEKSLKQIEVLVEENSSSPQGRWEFRGVRFDLNFSAQGEVLFFAKAGPTFRLRMEWNRRRVTKGLTPGSRFVRNILGVLDDVKDEISLPGFNVRLVSVGVGSTLKGETGVWKYSAGFLGFLLFAPRTEKSFMNSVELPSEDFILGGFDEKGLTTNRLSPARFSAGIRKSLQTAAFFADAARFQTGSWMVKDIRTVNDITHTGLFGLANLSSRGALEIFFVRNAQ